MMIKEKIASPFCEGDAVLKREKKNRIFRKETFKITEHYYQCLETGEAFTTDEIDQINLNQVYNQYRDRYGLPFPDQIQKIRAKYKVSAAKMSEILGLGANSYRLYEQGEVPSIGNGRLILAAEDPNELKRFLRTSQEVIGEKDLEKINRRVDDIINENERNKFVNFLKSQLFDVIVPDEYTGYRLPDLNKIAHMILYFSLIMDTWKTKLNKLLFYSDFMAFKHSGYGISGLDYRAIQMGPVPAKFEDMYNEIAREEIIVKREYKPTQSGNYGTVFLPVAEFDASLFDAFEMEIMQQVAHSLQDTYPNEIIEKSHQERAWQECMGDKQRISYKEYGFEIGGVSMKN